MEEFAVEIFSLLEKRKDELYSTLMIFFSDRVQIPESFDGTDAVDMGLPGEKYFTQVIDQNFSSVSTEWKKKWLMRTVFNNIIWEVIALQTVYAKKNDLSPLKKEESIKRIKNLCFCLTKGVSEEREELHEICFQFCCLLFGFFESLILELINRLNLSKYQKGKTEWVKRDQGDEEVEKKEKSLYHQRERKSFIKSKET